ncbi:hypothetical protein [Ornithinibacillus sp. 179-J 7C1 HS]|uniref:hypothetical protein n=1 Tax=Ornithinibacillus sp. 179-J 7C1 HS TaxID=3142384 RepID=UPI0039A1A422
MQLIYNEENILLENSLESIDVILNKVNKILENSGKVFSHLVINQVEVYENHEQYIRERISEIETIKIITTTMNEMIWNTMKSVHQYLVRAIPALNTLVDESYNNFTSETWNGINQLAEGMQWILQFKEVANAAVKQPTNWSKVEENLKVCEEKFAELLAAVEVKDTILISDILSYELVPVFELIKENLEIALKDEVFLQDVN